MPFKQNFTLRMFFTWGVQVNQLTKICWPLFAARLQTKLVGCSWFKPRLLPAMVARLMLETCMLLAGVREKDLIDSIND